MSLSRFLSIRTLLCISLLLLLGLWGVTTAYASWNAPIPANLDSAGIVGQYTSLAVVNGNPAISYYDGTNGYLKYVRGTAADGSSWGSPATVDNAADVGQYTSLAIVNGNPAISYYDSTNGYLKYVRASDANGSSWDSPLIVDNAADVGKYTSLAVVSGNPAIGYFDGNNGDLKFVRATDADGGAWSSAVTVDSPGFVGELAVLVVVNGNPAIAYFDGDNSSLKYVRASDANGSSWGSPVSVTSAWYVGYKISLAVVNGSPAISYFDGNNDLLKYVRASNADGSSWGGPVSVDNAATVGEYSSLVVLNGYPVISYYDGSNGDLKYVQASDANGSSWGSPVTLDSVADVGEHTSLAVVNGYPAISYYDHTNGDLKYNYYVPAPEIAVLGNGAVISNGDASPNLADNTKFLTLGGATTHAFTISNSGELDLNLAGSPLISISGPAAADYSVMVSPSTPVMAGDTTSFQLRFTPSVTGLRVITLTIANDDPDESSYAFAIDGNICTNAITVQNANDSGPGSLRQALADICYGGRIDFAADTAITLSSPLQIDRDLTLSGEGQTVTISGNDSVRILWVLADTQVTLEHLTIAHGKTTKPEVSDIYPAGGGMKIEAGSALTLTNSAVLSNTAVYYNPDWDEFRGLGGGIYNLGTLTVISTTFSGNTAGHSTAFGDGEGGALYNEGAATVTDSFFSNNGASQGGGISSQTSLTVQNSRFSDNSSPCGGAAIAGSGSTRVSDSTITNNIVPGDWCEGGAAGISNRFGVMTVQRLTISGNVNESSGGCGLSSYGYNPRQSYLTVIDSLIYSNTTNGSGGGIHNWWDSVITVTNSTIYSNTAQWYGGGILSGPHVNAKLSLINSTISYNKAQLGGGVYNAGPGYSAAVLSMTNTTIFSNTATDSGGGLYNWDSANVTLDNMILWGNSAPDGPQIYNTSANRPTIRTSDIADSGISGIWDVALGTDGGGNHDQDPLLGPLANNGGNTLTHALLPDSPIIDSGGTTACPATDQRDVTRGLDGDASGSGGCDLGAYELGELACGIQSTLEPYTANFMGGVGIETTDNGSDLECIRVTPFAISHLHATGVSGGSGITTGSYWLIQGLQSNLSSAATNDFTLNLTLPHNNLANPKICKWLDGLGPEFGWDCDRTGFTPTSVWLEGISSLSEWAVGSLVGPTNVTIGILSARSSGSNRTLEILGLCAGLVLSAAIIRRRRGWKNNPG